MIRHAAIHWKTNNAQHVTVKEGQIVEWNDALGTKPTDAEIDAWVAEYEVFKTADDKERADTEAAEALIQKRIRDNAIADLKKEGKLTAAGKVKK